MNIFPILFLLSLSAFARPEFYTELLDYVQEAPDQGEANSCLFMGNTGAMELLANKKAGIKNPKPFGTYDLAESYTMWAPDTGEGHSFLDNPVLRYNNSGYGIPASAWPFEAWTDSRGVNHSVWDKHPQMSKLPRIELPKVETIKLFQYGNRWSTRVLNDTHIEKIKEALWKYKSPILINYNDENYWHVILIVGYDDRMPGECYDISEKECADDVGSFYIRDSFGIKAELRDYDWFRIKGNAAYVIKLKE